MDFTLNIDNKMKGRLRKVYRKLTVQKKDKPPLYLNLAVPLS